MIAAAVEFKKRLLGCIARTECKDVACASLSVCLLVTTVSPTKTDEPIEVPFGLWTRVGPRNHVFPGEGAILGLFPPIEMH